jgi:hypothetical protein
MSSGKMSGIRYLHNSTSLLTNITLLDVFSSNLLKKEHHDIKIHNNKIINAYFNNFLHV